jgi:hypothetical protein
MQEKCQNIKSAGGNLDVNSNEDEDDLPNMLAHLGKRVDYRIEVGKQYAGFCRQAQQVTRQWNNFQVRKFGLSLGISLCF